VKLLAKPWPNYFWISCFFVLLSIICLTNYSQAYKILEIDFHTGKMWNCWRSPRQIIFGFPVFFLLRIICLTNYSQGYKILENDFHTGKMWNCWRSPRQIIFVFPVFLLLRIISLTNYYQGSKCSKIIFTKVKCENVGQSSPFSWGGGVCYIWCT